MMAGSASHDVVVERRHAAPRQPTLLAPSTRPPANVTHARPALSVVLHAPRHRAHRAYPEPAPTGMASHHTSRRWFRSRRAHRCSPRAKPGHPGQRNNKATAGKAPAQRSRRSASPAVRLPTRTRRRLSASTGPRSGSRSGGSLVSTQGTPTPAVPAPSAPAPARSLRRCGQRSWARWRHGCWSGPTLSRTPAGGRCSAWRRMGLLRR